MSNDSITVERKSFLGITYYRAETMVFVGPGSPWRSMFTSVSIVVTRALKRDRAVERCRKRAQNIRKWEDERMEKKRANTSYERL